MQYENTNTYTPANTTRLIEYTFRGVNGGLLLAVLIIFCRNRLIKKARNIRFQWQANAGRGKGEAMELPRVDRSTLSVYSIASGENSRLFSDCVENHPTGGREEVPGVVNIYPKLSELGKVDETKRPTAV